jgi:type II secretory pathway pseudopilin PulG
MKWRSVPRINIVELLVIIAVAAVLAALLFPVLTQARLRAGEGICLTNIKQIAVAARMYCSDYDGQLPTTPGSDPASGTRDVLLRPISPYH